MEVKGAYNTGYGFTKQRKGEVEQHLPFYRSSLENPALGYDSPDFNKEVVYKIKGANRNLQYDEHTSRSRNWYLEASLRYKRKWSSHNVGGLLDRKSTRLNSSHANISYAVFCLKKISGHFPANPAPLMRTGQFYHHARWDISTPDFGVLFVVVLGRPQLVPIHSVRLVVVKEHA